MDRSGVTLRRNRHLPLSKTPPRKRRRPPHRRTSERVADKAVRKYYARALLVTDLKPGDPQAPTAGIARGYHEIAFRDFGRPHHGRAARIRGPEEHRD